MELIIIFLLGVAGGYFVNKYQSKAKKIWQLFDKHVISRFEK
jgi:uncharacterized membrane protein